MQASQIALRRQSAMLDFEDGLLPDAEAELTRIIEDLGATSDPGVRYERCRTLVDRATVLTFANRWGEALDDLKACANAAHSLTPANERLALINVYQQQAKLYATPFSALYDPQAARAALSNLTGLNVSNWWIGNSIADLAYQEKDWKAAAEGYRQVAHELSNEGWARGAAASRLRAGCALFEQGDLAGAETGIHAALEFFAKYGPPDLLAATKVQVARLLLAHGETDGAWDLVQSALTLVETAIRQFRALFDQQRFLLDKLEYYQRAFAIGLAKGGAEGCWRAWTMAERAKSFYLCQLVANAEIGLFDGVDPEEVTQLRELERELDESESALGGPAVSDSDRQGRQDLEQRIQELSAAKVKLQERMMQANPRWAALKTPPAFELRSEVKKLDASWIPLSYFWEPQSEGARLHIFHCGSDREPVHLSTDWSQSELAQLDQGREKLRGVVSPMARIFPVELVKKVLPEALIEELAAGQRLLISPHESLRSTPLHALQVRPEQRLIDLCPVQYIPTLALLPFRNPAARSAKVLLLGCAQDGFGSPPLKEVPDELETLNDVWSAKRPAMVTKSLIASDASPSRAGLPLTEWGDFDVLHIACHGDFRDGRPFDAALRLGTDAIRASEFFGVRLKASLTSLSACSLGRQTGQHSGINLVGDEWIGLYLPLFYAGTRGLLVSLWDANSRVAAMFMKKFHGALSEGRIAAEAFQTAIQAVERKPEPLWANWYLVGYPD